MVDDVNQDDVRAAAYQAVGRIAAAWAPEVSSKGVVALVHDLLEEFLEFEKKWRDIHSANE